MRLRPWAVVAGLAPFAAAAQEPSAVRIEHAPVECVVDMPGIAGELWLEMTLVDATGGPGEWRVALVPGANLAARVLAGDIARLSPGAVTFRPGAWPGNAWCCPSEPSSSAL
jgi:hypothetical protein